MRFKNRVEAGQRMADRLGAYARRSDVVVLALPRGGVPLAFEVALRLEAPLDVFLVRKLGVPQHPELALGAIAAGGVEVLGPFAPSCRGVAVRISPEICCCRWQRQRSSSSGRSMCRLSR